MWSTGLPVFVVVKSHILLNLFLDNQATQSAKVNKTRKQFLKVNKLLQLNAPVGKLHLIC